MHFGATKIGAAFFCARGNRVGIKYPAAIATNTTYRRRVFQLQVLVLKY
jgi:hypothetical protein